MNLSPTNPDLPQDADATTALLDGDGDKWMVRAWRSFLESSECQQWFGPSSPIQDVTHRHRFVFNKQWFDEVEKVTETVLVPVPGAVPRYVVYLDPATHLPVAQSAQMCVPALPQQREREIVHHIPQVVCHSTTHATQEGQEEWVRTVVLRAPGVAMQERATPIFWKRDALRHFCATNGIPRPSPVQRRDRARAHHKENERTLPRGDARATTLLRLVQYLKNDGAMSSIPGWSFKRVMKHYLAEVSRMATPGWLRQHGEKIRDTVEREYWRE